MNKVPREDFVLIAFAVDPVRVVAAFFPDFEPFVKVKTIAVAFKDDALLVGGVNDWTEAAVATAVDCFQETCFPGRPVDFHVRVLEELFAHVTDVTECRFFVHKRSPLQARKRLRDENTDTHRNLNAAVILAPDFHEIEDELAECLHIIQVLGREAYHRVKLDLVEPAGECVFGSVVHVLVADGLVDHLADAFGTSFRCERGATTAFKCCNFFSETLSKTVDADTREAYVYVVIKRVVNDGIRERFDRLVVSGRK